jgi:hypothetical protein
MALKPALTIHRRLVGSAACSIGARRQSVTGAVCLHGVTSAANSTRLKTVGVAVAALLAREEEANCPTACAGVVRNDVPVGSVGVAVAVAVGVSASAAAGHRQSQ